MPVDSHGHRHVTWCACAESARPVLIADAKVET